MPPLDRRAFLAAALSGSLAACDPTPRVRARGSLARWAGAIPLPSSLGARPPVDPFEPDDALFRRKRRPEPGDWLAEHAEPYQGYAAYLAARPVRPTSTRSSIVLQPLGAFSTRGGELLRAVCEHARCFFSLDVEVARAVPLPFAERRTRRSGDQRWQQHHTGTLLKALARKLPQHAVAYLGVTEVDLYPEQSWNFVFGEATLDEHVGTYSLARFLPPFQGDRTPEEKVQALRRSIKLLAHETGHVFSLPHCARFECIMNGSNSLAETDRTPIELCPDCLRKLAHAIGFDPLNRYRALERFFLDWGLASEQAWIAERLSRLTAYG